jgi:DNA-binding transcriptional regulator YhcF (GntR family)
MTYRLKDDDFEVLPQNPCENDKLDRKDSVEFLSNLIEKLDGPFVMALDAPCIYFNAWKFDHVVDPMVAMVSEICQAGENKTGEISDTFGKLKKGTHHIAKRFAVLALENIISTATGGIITPDLPAEFKDLQLATSSANEVSNIVDSFIQENKSTEVFRDELKTVVEQLTATNTDQKQTKLVFFIDELDRCRPTFAIELLERVKHIFDVPNIIFILSIDKQQLEASVKAVYGAESKAAEYLRRFINLEYGLPAGIPKYYLRYLVQRFDLGSESQGRTLWSAVKLNDFIAFFASLATAMGLSLRACESCFTRLRVVSDQPSNFNYNPYLLALLIILRSNNNALFKEFIAGKSNAGDVIKFLEKFHLDDEQNILIHALLLAADTDSSRVEQQIKQLREEKAGRYVDAVVSKMKNIQINEDYLFDIVKKIELAANIR